MLKVVPEMKVTDADTLKLNSKMFSVASTNVCSLHCGGCDQFCGYFNKEKLFFITLEELNTCISVFRRYRDQNWHRSDFPAGDKVFIIHGGEPTLHPQFDEMMEMLYKNDDIPFCMYTNGRTWKEHFKHIDTTRMCHDVNCAVYLTETLPRNGYEKFLPLFERFHAHEKNVAWRIDYKIPETRDMFVATMCAPCDLEEDKNPDGIKYWQRAKQVCYKWHHCESSIYNGKAYVCNVAAAMDHMYYGGKYGWKVKPNENPFNKTSEEIAEQMKHFCYRCGYNIKGNFDGFRRCTNRTQMIDAGSMISDTNLKDVDKDAPCSPMLEPIKPLKKRIPLEVFR